MIKGITSEPLPVYEVPAYGAKGYPFRVTNLDPANPVYFELGSQTVNSTQSSALRPLATANFDGTEDVWMSSGTPGRVVAVDFSRSVIRDTALSAGVPPSVPNMASYAGVALSPVGSPVLLGSGPFPAPSRIWSAQISLACATAAAYAAATNGVNARIQTNVSNIILVVAELEISQAGQAVAVAPATQFFGINVAAGDQLEVLINSGITIPNAVIRVSAVVLASTP